MFRRLISRLRLMHLISTAIFAQSVVASSETGSVLAISATESIRQYVKSIELTREEPNPYFVGFYASQSLAGQLNVDIFHADSPLDITTKEFSCIINSDRQAECKLMALYPRCFYYANSGRFSVKDFESALQFSMDLATHLGLSSEKILGLKVWQNDYELQGKIFVETTSLVAPKALFFSCQRSNLDLSCKETTEPGNNEP